MTHEADGLTLLGRAGRFVGDLSYADQPEHVREKVQAHLLDVIGLMLMARRHPNVVKARRFAQATGSGEEPEEAIALIGGVAADALGLDDFDEPTRMHPGALVVPAVLAAASKTGGNGKQLLAGVFAGYELACRLGDLFGSNRLHERGFHPSAIVGGLAAAGGVARFYGLGAEDISHCVGLAASLVSGLFELDPAGSIKGLQTGWASRNGVAAFRLYEAGYRPSSKVLDGNQGMWRAFGPAHDSGGAPAGLSGPPVDAAFSPAPRVERISFKAYTHFTDLHPAAAVLLRVLQERNVRAADIVAIRVRLPVHVEKKLNDQFPPPSVKAARRCPRFAMATIAHHYRPGRPRDPFLDAFGDDVLRDPQVLDLAGRTDWTADLPASERGRAVVEVQLRDGTVVAEEGEGYPGDGRSAETRWSASEVAERFVAANANDFGAAEAERWVHELLQLESASDVTSLVDRVKGVLLNSPGGV